MSATRPHPIHIVGGIDPGLSSGGVVLLQRDPERVLAAISLVEPAGSARAALAQARAYLGARGGWGDVEFTAAMIRAKNWMTLFRSRLDAVCAEVGPVDIWAIESFVDQRSRAREEKARLLKNRWMTPLVIGMLADELEARGMSLENDRIVYQNAGIVIRQMAEEIGRLKDRRRSAALDVVIPGDRLVTNDHLRKAFAHALALHMRLPSIL